MAPAFQAFIDEAGQRSTSRKSSDHFVLSAVIIEDVDLAAVATAQARLRRQLGRQPDHPIHWQNLKGHAHRVHAVRSLAAMPITISSVVVCKRYLGATDLPDEHHAYLYTLRFLLERLSWFSRDRSGTMTYILAAIVRFKLSKLRTYEALLRADPTCEIKWSHLDSKGGSIDQPTRVEQLQLADIAASATFQAFESDQFENTEPRYLREMANRLYRRPPGALTSYGLKMHPWNAVTREAYAWVTGL